MKRRDVARKRNEGLGLSPLSPVGVNQMRQAALIPVSCALVLFTTAFLPGIGRDDGTSAGTSSSRKAIPVGSPTLLEAVRGGREEILSLLLQAGVDPGAGGEDDSDPLLLSLRGGRGPQSFRRPCSPP